MIIPSHLFTSGHQNTKFEEKFLAHPTLAQQTLINHLVEEPGGHTEEDWI